MQRLSQCGSAPIGKDKPTSTSLPTWTWWAVWSAMKGSAQDCSMNTQHIDWEKVATCSEVAV
eukprot:5990122-Amphidinium_carterae.3